MHAKINQQIFDLIENISLEFQFRSEMLNCAKMSIFTIDLTLEPNITKNEFSKWQNDWNSIGKYGQALQK